MNTAFPEIVLETPILLEEVVGYLNFSSGASDAKFLANFNELFRRADTELRSAKQAKDQTTVALLCCWLNRRIDDLEQHASAFNDVAQARAVVELVEQQLLPAYRQFHRDLLWHQSEEQLWRPLFLARAVEALLAQGGPWNETGRILEGALGALNDYIGYRPVAALESDQRMEPYPHEWVRPIPLYIEDVGVAHGPYRELVQMTLEILADTKPELLRDAWFDPALIEELALDPRAYDFDHPVNKRPNYHFGQWDPHRIDNRGFYRRFVLQQIALDSLLERVVEADHAKAGRSTASRSRQELMFEAAAVLAGTMLMASGTCGNGPGCHGSDVTLGTLLPHIADYRDRFYAELLERIQGAHGERLREEARRARQPFGGARQHLNQELARRRAKQLQHVHLAQVYARMGYPTSALSEARTVRVASARMLSQIYCRLTASHQAIDAGKLAQVAHDLPEIEDLLHRGIECGALVDPWNIIGFGGNFSLFPALENSIHDFRVDDMIELVEQVLDLCSRAWTESAAIDDAKHEQIFSVALSRLATWWDQYATPTVSDIKHIVGKEIEISTNLVAGALNAWHKAGAASGDIKFWRMFVDQFDSPKAFQLVVEALLDQGDLVASMALMMQWVSQAERTPLDNGDASFHPLALRWLRLVERRQQESGEDQWPLVAKFFAHLEASAESYWHVPTFKLGAAEDWEEIDDLEDLDFGDGDEGDDLEDDLDDDLDSDVLADDYDEMDEDLIDEEDELDNLFSAAYEDVVYRDSTDDGLDSALMEGASSNSDLEAEEEARRLGERLLFLNAVARLWKHAAIAWNAHAAGDANRGELLDQWHQQATERYSQLIGLLEAVHRYRLPPPLGSQESMMEYDRRRVVKETLVEQIITTSVEMSDAGRLLRAAAGQRAAPADNQARPSPLERTIELLRSLLAGDADGVRHHWKEFAASLADQELLYIPLAKGGNPRRIVKARALGQLIHDLVGWLPRLGLVREACELLAVAQQMERAQKVEQEGAVTEYDRLFANGYKAVVRCLVASAEVWDRTDETRASEIGCIRASDSMLVDALQDLTESLLGRWLEHSRTLRLSVVEKLMGKAEWQPFVDFVKRYGEDIFQQQFLNLGNLRTILHQGVPVWLSNLQYDPDAEDLRLVRELNGRIDPDDAARWLAIAIEAVVENYREYRDYNSTTTQSDHGQSLYTFVDFLRLRVAYDRVAWNLKPVVMAHEILVRQDRPAAAELWQRALAERTADAADAHLQKFQQLSESYGMRLPTVAERLAERFTRPLAIDRLRALIAPAIAAADEREESEDFAALRREIESLASEPSGAGLDVPDWLAALEEEVTTVRLARRHHEPSGDPLCRIHQVRLDWHDLQQQLADFGGAA